MHHKTKEAAVKKYAPIYAERGEDETVQHMENDEIEVADQAEIIGEIKAQIKAFAESIGKKSGVDIPSAGGTPNIERNNTELSKGQKLYDLYNVIPLTRPMKNDPRKNEYTGEFEKVGKPKKTNIKVIPENAELINSQSLNSKERLFEVEL